MHVREVESLICQLMVVAGQPVMKEAGLWHYLELPRGKLTEVWMKNTELADKLIELGYKDGKVKLKISVSKGSGAPYKSKPFNFNVSNAKMEP